MIFIVVLLLIYVVIVVFFGGEKKNDEEKFTNNYLLVGDNLIWHEKDNKWYQETEATDEMLDRQFTVFNGDKKYKVKHLQYVEGLWWFFDDDFNELARDNYTIAYSGDVKVSPVNYYTEKYNTNDDQYIMNVTNSNNALQFEDYKNSLSKITLDYDDDGAYEILYTIASASLEDKVSSYMFVVKNNEVIDKVEVKDEVFNVVSVLDFDNDNKLEIVVFKGDLNTQSLESCFQLYKLQNNKLKSVQKCLYNNE